MASNNVAQFAAELKMPAGVLLEQLQAAGVTESERRRQLVRNGQGASARPLAQVARLD